MVTAADIRLKAVGGNPGVYFHQRTDTTVSRVGRSNTRLYAIDTPGRRTETRRTLKDVRALIAHRINQEENDDAQKDT